MNDASVWILEGTIPTAVSWSEWAKRTVESNWHNEQPILFEAMVFGGHCDEYQAR
jgi:hypothetical protein